MITCGTCYCLSFLFRGFLVVVFQVECSVIGAYVLFLLCKNGIIFSLNV